jgi:hypothetical protein
VLNRSPDGELFAHVEGPRVFLIPRALAFGEREYRLFWTRPDAAWHRQEYTLAVQRKDSFAAGFHLNRLLAHLPAARPALLSTRLKQSTGDVVGNARTAIHSPAIAKQSANLMLFLAVQGNQEARRLLGGLLLRQGKPTAAEAPLLAALKLRAADAPPVEELLLSIACAEMNRPEDARKWLDRAVDWIDRYRTPLQVVRAIGGGAGSPLCALTELHKYPGDPRYDPLDWETWYELEVFRHESERRLKPQP